MASVEPLYYNGSGALTRMTAGEINQWRQKAIFVYASSPTAVLTQVSSSGALIDGMADTRTAAGAASQSASAFVYASGTAEPTTVTVAFDKINLAYTIPTFTADTNGIAFPVYQENSGGTIRSMTAQDLVDTFCKPAIDLLVADIRSKIICSMNFKSSFRESEGVRGKIVNSGKSDKSKQSRRSQRRR